MPTIAKIDINNVIETIEVNKIRLVTTWLACRRLISSISKVGLPAVRPTTFIVNANFSMERPETSSWLAIQRGRK